MLDHHYLELLAREYPTIQAASTEIINLRAIISLPKGTEYFFSDLHGEHEAFIHLLHSASGVIRKKIDELFDKTLVDSERMALALLIYYPEQQISIAKTHKENYDEWCKITLYRLVQVCKESASKYTRSKVRKCCQRITNISLMSCSTPTIRLTKNIITRKSSIRLLKSAGRNLSSSIWLT